MIIDVTRNFTDLKSNEGHIPLPHFPTDGSVAVSYLYIEFETQLSKELVTLTSTFVDRNSKNPYQQLCSYFHSGQSKYSCYTPTHLLAYKMNCTPSSDAVVKIHTEKPKKIKKIYLQLIVDVGLFKKSQRAVS